MLSRQEKINGAQEFIKSAKFGIDTYTTIGLFYLNLRFALRAIELNGVVQNRLDDKNIGTELSEQERLLVKETMTLDIIMKIEILIESTLVLVDALSKDYKHIPKNMTRYHFNLIPKIIKNIHKNKYNLRKVLGLPKIDTLPISSDEKKYIGVLFSKASETLKNALKELIEFYQDFSITYGKSKHGLTFFLGLQLESDDTEAGNNHGPETQVIQSLDRRNRRSMPPGYLVSTSENQEFNFTSSYFNVISVIKVDKSLFEKISRINSILNQVVGFICENHLIYAANCGESYLPYTKKGKKIGVRYFGLDMVGDEKRLIEIFAKVLPVMNTNNFDLHTKTNFNNPSVVENLDNKIVTNILLSSGRTKDSNNI